VKLPVAVDRLTEKAILMKAKRSIEMTCSLISFKDIEPKTMRRAFDEGLPRSGVPDLLCRWKS
jgi:hypothetical protein